jgi:Ca2+:H+ antiporter
VVSVARQLTRAVTTRWLNVLLIVAPVSWWLDWRGETSIWLFVTAAVALIPAAGLIGEATEELANHSGPTLGGFLNATFGNAAEFIIAIVALRAHHVDVVKASITGSIIGNILLVFGLSAFVGGLRHGTQRFSRGAGSSPTVMLTIAVAALVMPATVALFAFGSLTAHPEVLDRLSLWTSWILLGVYAGGLIFAFRTQRDPLRPGGKHAAQMSRAASIVLLAVGTLLTAIEAEILIAGLAPALKQLGMTELFAGVIVVAVVGNAAEHYSAIVAAAKNDMTLAVEISIGSSAQIALMVAPLIVILAPWIAQPMTLVMNPFELGAIGLSVVTVSLVVNDGESHWLEGLQLLGLYLILAAAFYVIPG